MGIPTSLINIAKAQLAPTLTKVINCQLDRLNVIQSDKYGVTRLIPKTERGVIPRVDQLTRGPHLWAAVLRELRNL